MQQVNKMTAASMPGHHGCGPVMLMEEQSPGTASYASVHGLLFFVAGEWQSLSPEGINNDE